MLTMTTTLIAKRSRVGGRVEADGDVVVEGRVEGTIVAGGAVLVGPSGVAVAEIQAGRISVLGIVIGNMSASERVDVAGTARIIGDVRAPLISIAPPAVIEGRTVELGKSSGPPAETSNGGPAAQRPTLRIRNLVVRPAPPEAAPELADSQRTQALRSAPHAPVEAAVPPPPSSGPAPRLRTRDPRVVPEPPRPPTRVHMSPRPPASE